MADKGNNEKDKYSIDEKFGISGSLGKWPEPTVCKICQAVYIDGHWSWEEIPEEANEIICPACQRYENNQPAGTINLKGYFYKEHKEKILKLITEAEKKANNTHPMERIMSISDKRDHVIVTTTGVFLARKIAEVLRNSFEGEVDFNFQDNGRHLNVIMQML